MIASKQRIDLLNRFFGASLQSGRFPILGQVIAQVSEFLQGQRLGAPLTRLRAAEPGQPIGGPQGSDIQLTFEELLNDLNLLFDAELELSARALDLYDLFSTRQDRLALKLRELRQNASTALALQAAGSRTSVVEAFHTLDQVDLGQTTAAVNLAEGYCTLPPNLANSVSYDGSRVEVTHTTVPPGGKEHGHPFQSVFSPYRLDAWYAVLPAGTVFEAQVNVTGADYTQGSAAEVVLNAIRVDPTGPLTVAIDWSPDGFNWHALSPVVSQVVRDQTTFHFSPVTVGFIRFRVSPVAAGAQTATVGLKGIDFLLKGFSTTASLYSTKFTFDEVVNTVVVTSSEQVPHGTAINAYVAQDTAGPWTPVGPGPIVFDTIQWQDIAINALVEEQPGVPATLWEAGIPTSAPPLPNTGELIAGRGQVRIEAFPFDWRQLGDHDHILGEEDWGRGLGLIREGVFSPIGGLGTTDIAASGFLPLKNPLATDDRDASQSYMVLALLGTDGQFVLQPGYNYRLHAYLWCSAPVTLDKQRLGIVNPAASGGVAGTEVCPLSVFVNGRKLFQSQASTTSAALLASPQYETSIPLLQGFNHLEVMLQVPADLAPGVNGLASGDVYLYLQPNLFSQSLSQGNNIDYIQAWGDPWKRVSEFDLRYNTPLGNREAWAFQFDAATNTTTGILLNFDPTNSASRATLHPSYKTLDGIIAGYPVNLLLHYPVQRSLAADTRSLYFRADFTMEGTASAPPQLFGYRILVD